MEGDERPLPVAFTINMTVGRDGHVRCTVRESDAEMLAAAEIPDAEQFLAWLRTKIELAQQGKAIAQGPIWTRPEWPV